MCAVLWSCMYAITHVHASISIMGGIRCAEWNRLFVHTSLWRWQQRQRRWRWCWIDLHTFWKWETIKVILSYDTYLILRPLLLCCFCFFDIHSLSLSLALALSLSRTRTLARLLFFLFFCGLFMGQCAVPHTTFTFFCICICVWDFSFAISIYARFFCVKFLVVSSIFVFVFFLKKKEENESCIIFIVLWAHVMHKMNYPFVWSDLIHVNYADWNIKIRLREERMWKNPAKYICHASWILFEFFSLHITFCNNTMDCSNSLTLNASHTYSGWKNYTFFLKSIQEFWLY